MNTIIIILKPKFSDFWLSKKTRRFFCFRPSFGCSWPIYTERKPCLPKSPLYSLYEMNDPRERIPGHEKYISMASLLQKATQPTSFDSPDVVKVTKKAALCRNYLSGQGFFNLNNCIDFYRHWTLGPFDPLFAQTASYELKRSSDWISDISSQRQSLYLNSSKIKELGRNGFWLSFDGNCTLYSWAAICRWRAIVRSFSSVFLVGRF